MQRRLQLLRNTILTATILSVALLATVQAQDGGRIMPPPMPHPVIQRDLTLTDMRVDVRIDGSVARTTIRQTLRNDGSRPAEGQYMLPLPDGASVSDFAIIDGDQRLTAELLPADEARRIYQEIVRQMRDPGLLEYQDSRTFSVAVFPFAPGQSRSIEVSFQQALSGTTDLVTYELPLRWAGWSRNADYQGVPFALTYEVNSSHPLGSVSSPTYGISVHRQGDNRVYGSYEGRVPHFSNDFTLNIGRRTGEFAASLTCFPAAGGEDGYFLLSLLAAMPPSGAHIPKDVLFIFDKSGSMSGSRIDQAKGALRFVLGQLNPADRFNVLYFSDTVESVFPELRSVERISVEAAQHTVDALTATGGTDINSALTVAAKMLGPAGNRTETISFSGSPTMPPDLNDEQRHQWIEANITSKALRPRTDGFDRPTYVIFLTDGQPTVGDTNLDNIVANAQRSFASGVRLFVFGVGYDVNTTLLDKLSYNHAGSATYVTEGENIEVKVSQFYAKMSSPALTGISLSLDGLDEYDLMPRELPDLFHNTELFVAGRYRGAAAQSVGVSLSGRGEDGTRTLSSRISPQVGGEHGTVPRLWATRKVSFLLDQVRLQGDNRELVDEIERLALRFGIVTPYTSYLITEPGMDLRGRQLALEENISAARRDSTGQGAVQRSAQAQANQAADASSAPQSAGQSAGGGGVPLPAPAPPPPPVIEVFGRDGPDDDVDWSQPRSRADENTAVNYVGSQTFMRRVDDESNLRWVDARQEDAPRDVLRVQAFSELYFELLALHPWLGDFLAQGERVVLVLDDGLALETTPEEVQLSASDEQRLREALGRTRPGA